MSEISAASVMKLRQITGCGLMECKKALAACEGDIESAKQKMKEAGILKAEKKSSRQAFDGIVKVATAGDIAVMLEVNCETDFVARDENLQNFVDTLSKIALDKKIDNIDELSKSQYDNDHTVEEMRQAVILKVGENIQLRRIVKMQAQNNGCVGYYAHGVKVAVMVNLSVNDPELGKDIAMHITATKPKSIDENDFPAKELEAEKSVYDKQAATSGKPQEIQDKIVAGRVRKYLQEHTLLAQPFVKDNDVTIADLLKKSGAKVLEFQCFTLGEEA